MEYQKNVKVLDRDNVGLVAKFDIAVSRRRSTSFCLATTHLLFNPKAGDVKLAQMVCLLAELNQLATPPASQPRLPCIVCGDLNSLPSSPLLQLLENGQLCYSGLRCDEVAGYRYRGSSRLVPSPLLPPEVPINHVTCRFISKSDESTPVTQQEEGLLFHGTKFLPVYPSTSPCHPRPPSSSGGSSNQPSSGESAATAPALCSSDPSTSSGSPSTPGSPGRPTNPSSVTTYHLKAFETVDYIHYTAATLVSDHSPSPHSSSSSSRRRPSSKRRGGLEVQEPGFNLLGRRSLISPQRLREMGPQPHRLLPSDHLWLLARLQLFPPPPTTSH